MSFSVSGCQPSCGSTAPAPSKSKDSFHEAKAEGPIPSHQSGDRDMAQQGQGGGDTKEDHSPGELELKAGQGTTVRCRKKIKWGERKQCEYVFEYVFENVFIYSEKPCTETETWFWDSSTRAAASPTGSARLPPDERSEVMRGGRVVFLPAKLAR